MVERREANGVDDSAARPSAVRAAASAAAGDDLSPVDSPESILADLELLNPGVPAPTPAATATTATSPPATSSTDSQPDPDPELPELEQVIDAASESLPPPAVCAPPPATPATEPTSGGWVAPSADWALEDID